MINPLFLILQSISGGVAGYITNKYAVNMLFKEYTPLKLGGVVKKNKEKFIDEIKLQNKNVLLVTHGGISRAIYWYFNGIPKNGNSSNINENCKIYEYDL